MATDKACPVCRLDIDTEEHEEHVHPHGEDFSIKSFIKLLSLLTVFLLIGFAGVITNSAILSLAGFLAVLVIGGGRLAKIAFREFIEKRIFSIEFLVVIAAVGAFLIKEYAEGAVVVYLFNIAVFLEEYAADKARRDIALLLREKPSTARVLRNGKEVVVRVEDVQPGETIVVKPGDKVPLDGTIIKGSVSIDESPLTGESVPVEKKPGDKAYAGTICTDGVLFIRVEKRSGETLLARVIELVEKARREKSRIERFVEKFSKYYTPTVIMISILVALIPPFMLGGDMGSWIYRALTLLVISCPCALVISVPVAMVSGLVGSARNGALVKGGKHLEHLASVSIMAFDKTGTLTKGSLKLSGIKPVAVDGEQLLKIAASLSRYSNHPIAEIIVREAEHQGIELLDVIDFKSLPGRGVISRIDGEVCVLGNEKLLEEIGIKYEHSGISGGNNSIGDTLSYVVCGSKILGVLGFEDEIRTEAIEVIRDLKRRGLEIVMLTGDREKVARRITKILGVDRYFAELLPEDKVTVIEKLMEDHKRHVAMVGDGINDAPALARSCVGIAVGSGAEIAIESGDIVLVKPNLKKLPYLVDLSRKVLSTIRINVLASISVKLSLVALAILGMINLWMAVLIGDMGLSLAVIGFSLRLSGFTAEK